MTLRLPLIPMKNLGNLYVNGGNLIFLDTTHILVTPGAFRDSTDVNDIVLRPTITQANATATGNPDKLVIDANAPNTTISVRANGANGLDTGVLAVNSFYYVYAIGDSSAGDIGGFEFIPTACLLSLSTNAVPKLPAGYDMFRRIGTILTDNTAAPNTLVVAFSQTGATQSRAMWYDTPLLVLNAGATNANFTDVPLGTFAAPLFKAVPPIATDVTFDASYTPTAAGNVAAVSHLAAAAATVLNNGNVTISGTVAAVLQEEQITCPCSILVGQANVSYRNVGTLSLSVQSYVDQL